MGNRKTAITHKNFIVEFSNLDRDISINAHTHRIAVNAIRMIAKVSVMSFVFSNSVSRQD